MPENACVFCKIVSGEIPSQKFWEDGNFIAILDIRPNMKGQSLLIPKRHTESKFSDQSDEDLARIMSAAKKVAIILEKRLGAKRVLLVFEGLDVNHLHAKLFPYYEHGTGITRLGPPANIEELEAVKKLLTKQ
ncbi:MAG: HIT family protein [Candidatus Micrarchaeales archaeon]|nr:HIT family protein [Candidatus Micrarchaeales archaeon]